MGLVAVTMAAVTLTTYIITINCLAHDQAVTLAFTALVVMQWSSALNLRGTYEGFFARFRTMNRGLFIALALAIILQVLAFTTDTGRAILHMVPVPIVPLLLSCLAAFIIPIIVIQLHKLYVNRKLA
jgi:magnesium-transporting ATPase (P-type)